MGIVLGNRKDYETTFTTVNIDYKINDNLCVYNEMPVRRSSDKDIPPDIKHTIGISNIRNIENFLNRKSDTIRKFKMFSEYSYNRKWYVWPINKKINFRNITSLSQYVLDISEIAKIKKL